MDVYNLLSDQMNGGGPCARVVVASCLMAKVQDKGSPRFGQLSPQAKVACQLNRGEPESSLWAVGIVGLKFGEASPVFVTGHSVHYSALVNSMKRDGCIPADVTYAQKLFNRLPPPVR